MGRALLATLLALASISSGIVASPTPQPVERSASAVDDKFQWNAGAGVHLVECSPLPAEEGSSTEQSWLSLVIYCENDAECSDVKHVPAKRDVCVKKTSNVTNDFQKWESTDGWIYCHFEERGWFSWVVVRFARLFPPDTEIGIAVIGDPNDDASPSFSGFVDTLAQGAGPATHTCSKVYRFS
ncbi:hypothetical protein B0T16DRAFT_513638 [Cercophora newfieldiana]|uniref:Uncharacterized protein n=1 Tax=Cercophora newfieldiana TaxID=92897 RepID=A0AA39Y4A9_9PEZI|nr:hypothetical protein B0T16DRAFT_513638 [Cercophora newfieldiana]